MTRIIDFFTGGWMRWAALAVVLALGIAFARMHWIQAGREQILRENATAAIKIVEKQGKVTERVVTQYVKVAGATKVVTETVEREVVKYAEANPGLCLDNDWRRLHDGAALNRIPPAPSRPPAGLRAPSRVTGLGYSPDGGAGVTDGGIKLRSASSLRGSS